MPLEDLEKTTEALARALVEGPSNAAPFVPGAAFFDEQVLGFCMRHPRLKAELFRFVDVLPALHADDVAGHLVQYLGDARDALPLPLRWTLDLASDRRTVGRIVARAARRNVLRVASRFIAGTTPRELLGAIAELRRRRLAVTLDALGEAVVTEREADQYRDQYLELLRDTARAVDSLPEDPLIDRDHDGTRLPRVNISVKLSALTPLFDPIDPDGVARRVVPRFRAILDAAARASAFVYVDMEQYERKDLTLALFCDTLEKPPHSETANVGIVLQAYLRDTEDDIERLAAWAKRRGRPVWVRLVKGAYFDSETVIARQHGWPVPVWEEKWQTDAAYERCTDRLLDAGGALRPAFASHNARSLAHALAAARARGLPERFVEVQALFGMADPLIDALVQLGQRVRIYAPFGELVPGMAYLVRRLLENTSNESFVLRAPTAEDAVSALVAAPSPPSPIVTMEKRMTETHKASSLEAFRNEPLRDFSRQETRTAARAALDGVARALPLRCPPVIDGREVDTGDTIESVSPSDARRVVAVSGSCRAEHADLAVRVALAGAPEWRAVPTAERARILEEVATKMVANRDELAALCCLEAGKPWRDADAEVAEAIDFCRFYAAAARALAEPERTQVPGEENATELCPRGPTAVIAPWNFPVAILTGMTAAPLVVGNPVIMKPAEQTPACASLVFRLFREAGVPASVLQFLPGNGETVGARLVEHEDIATIVFTGSRAVGHTIARRAAETSTGRFGIKRTVLEMGGKNAIVVDDDADLDEAVPGVLQSAFGYAGQKCSACSRVIVVGRAYDPFVRRLGEAAGTWIVGPAEEPESSVGPLIDRESVERLGRYASLGEREGRVLFRGTLGAGCSRGFFFPPTIVADLRADAALSREEVFGPLLAVFHVENFEAALLLANSTDYALTGGLYSRSPANIARARRDFDVGNLYINRKITGAQVARQPFGGHRHSGTGSKAGGRDYLLHFGVLRTVTENTMRRGFAMER